MSSRREGALLAGTVGTFDTLFAHLAGPGPRVLGDAERSLVVRRLVAGRRLASLGPSARFAGYADALAGALAEIEAAMLEPDDLAPELGRLTGRTARSSRASARRDRGMLRRRAVERLTGDSARGTARPCSRTASRI